MLYNIDARHYGTGAALLIFLLAAAGSVYCANCHIAGYWPHLFAATAVFSGVGLIKTLQPPEFILDHRQIEKLMLLTPQEVRSIISYYQFITPRMIRELWRAVDHRNFEEARFIARRLASSSDAIGAVQLAAIARDVAQAIDADRITALPRLCAELEKTYPKTENALMKIADSAA